LAEEAAVLRQRLNDLATDYADGILSRAQLHAGTEKIKARLAEVEQAMADAYTPDYGDLEWVAYEIDEMDIDQQRALVRTLVASVVLDSPGRGQRPTVDHIRVACRLGRLAPRLAPAGTLRPGETPRSSLYPRQTPEAPEARIWALGPPDWRG
jgi:hypothetical protein